ncbi:MAG: carbohydrate kinase [Verrucomicrobia bacterium]|nr:carbohydrate kinase [Verrucomicrobiota bacterium]
MPHLSVPRVAEILEACARVRVLVIGDLMLDQFIWGRVGRISPEAPVPIVEFERESFMPGGAANVARNLTALGGQAVLFGVIGADANGAQMRTLLQEQRVDCSGLVVVPGHHTTTKTRIVAQRQQITRLDRESCGEIDSATAGQLLERLDEAMAGARAVSIGDYGKGVVSTELLRAVKERCHGNNCWLSMDPKPVHHRDLTGLSVLTPNRKEAFELAGVADAARNANPLQDAALMQVVDLLMTRWHPRLLLITLGELGLLLCQPGAEPFHVPTVAREVFDVSGAGDTVIASFTLAIAAGATPMEAAVFSNHAAGVVVGKLGTATASPAELLATFEEAA